MIDLKKKYYNEILKRYDDYGLTLNSFLPICYDGLIYRDFDFTTLENHHLKGYLYHYEKYDNSKLVIFSHGLGAGHLTCMSEIISLCLNGYEVLSYDAVGCEKSSGERLYAVNEFVNDLDQYLNYVEKSEELKNKEIILVGHSCGAYAAGCNLKNHQISKAILLAPFNKVEDLIRNLYHDEKMVVIANQIEHEVYPKYDNLSLCDCLKNTNTKTLIVQSLDDNIVDFEHGLNKIKENVDNHNIEYLILNNKYHNPTYTDKAVKLLQDFVTKFSSCKTYDEQKEVASKYNFHDVTKQDEFVWNKIIEFIKK